MDIDKTFNNLSLRPLKDLFYFYFKMKKFSDFNVKNIDNIICVEHHYDKQNKEEYRLTIRTTDQTYSENSKEALKDVEQFIELLKSDKNFILFSHFLNWHHIYNFKFVKNCIIEQNTESNLCWNELKDDHWKYHKGCGCKNPEKFDVPEKTNFTHRILCGNVMHKELHEQYKEQFWEKNKLSDYEQ